MTWNYYSTDGMGHGVYIIILEIWTKIPPPLIHYVFREVNPSNYERFDRWTRPYIATHGGPTGVRLPFYYVATIKA